MHRLCLTSYETGHTEFSHLIIWGYKRLTRFFNCYSHSFSVLAWKEFPEACSFFLPLPISGQGSNILKIFHVSCACLPAVMEQQLLPALDRAMQPPLVSCLLEEAEDEGVEPHGVVGELCVLADLAVEAVQQLCRGAYEEKQIVEISCGGKNQNCPQDGASRQDRCCLGVHVCVHCLSTTPV